MNITKNIFLWKHLLVACLGAVLCLLADAAMAADYYVTPTGAGDYGGTNWHNAYSNVQTAASLATNAGGDTILLRWGVYSNAAQIVISNAPNLTLQGGCWGLSGGSSNDYSGTNSTLTRAGATMRIFYGANSTVTMQRLTVSGGYFSSGTNNGAGLCFQGCAVTLTNCVVCDNTNYNDQNVINGYGGGLYCYGGSLAVNDCVFSNNTMRRSTSISLWYPGGGAVAGSNTPMTIAGTLFVTNMMHGSSWVAFSGGAVDSSGASVTISNCVFRSNVVKAEGYSSSWGGAMRLSGGSAVIQNSSFVSNSAQGNGGNFGGGVYLENLASAVLQSNYFGDNFLNGAVAAAVYLTNCGTATLDGCLVEGRGQNVQGEHILIQGGSNTYLWNTTVRSNGYHKGIVFMGVSGSRLVMTNCQVANNGSDGVLLAGGTGIVTHCTLANNLGAGVGTSNSPALWMTNCQVANNGSDGLRVAGQAAGVAHSALANNAGQGVNWSGTGTLWMTNCLLAQNGGAGLLLGAGTSLVAHCSLVDNMGWGVQWTGGTGAVINSIAWGNTAGGLSSNASLAVTYSCSQNPPYGAGPGNIFEDPLFAPVAGYYYLSETNLAEQTNHSPCIDAGLGNASDYGLNTRTTRTDGSNDTGVVDLGYHYTNGVAVPHLFSVCYVDAVNGNDGDSGLAWTSAWKSVTHAMTNVAANGTINLATGVYSAAATLESFPLVVQMANLTLAASNSSPVLTVLDNAGTAGRRVLQASCKGTILLRGLTIRGGNFSAGANNGAGLCFQGCAATLTNCVVRDNTNYNDVSAINGYGGGMYCYGGSLAVNDCVFSNNTMRRATAISLWYPGGGAVAGSNTPMTIAGTLFVTNMMHGYSWLAFSGGAVDSSGASVTISNCVFRSNVVKAEGYSSSWGGAMRLSGGSAVIQNCSFVSNSAQGNGGNFGGGVYLENLASAVLRSNYFGDNFLNGAVAAGLYLTNCGTATLDGCLVEGRSQNLQGEHILIQGGSNTYLWNTTVRSNGYHKGIVFMGVSSSRLVMTNCQVANNGSDGVLLAGGTGIVTHSTLANNLAAGVGMSNSPALWMTNCQVANNGGDGLRVAGQAAGVAHSVLANNAGQGVNWSGTGTLWMTNCLLAQNGSAGLLMGSGTGLVAHCSLVDNMGWGVQWSGGTGAVLNSIAWGNSAGGLSSNANLGVTYSCCQNPPYGAGAGNIFEDPLFAPVAGYYYLSETNLAEQTNHSPCIDAGFGQAADYGLNARTTRTDGSNDTGVVDLGYHYTNGVAVPHLVPVCYVDAVDGSNTYDGLSWTSAWKSVTHAMTNVAANGTINLATGVYSAAATLESFPLAVQMANLTLAASNSSPGLTVLDNAGASGKRVLQASCKGNILLKGLTIRGGYFASGGNNGAGLCFQGCAVMLTNCVVRDNTNCNDLSVNTGYGGGLYCCGGSLTVNSCVFSNNSMVRSGNENFSSHPCGGALAGSNTAMAIAGTLFVTNSADGSVRGAYCGGAIDSCGAAVTISNCVFYRNHSGGYGYSASWGGALRIATGPVVIWDSSFVSNSAAGNGGNYGGAVFLESVVSAVLQSNALSYNYLEGGEAAALYLTNCGAATLDGCLVEGRGQSVAGEHIRILGGSNTYLWNTTVRSNVSYKGIVFLGGSGSQLVMTNCQVVNNGSDGVLLAGGTGIVTHCTLASNLAAGVGTSNSPALWMTNCLAIGNRGGGLRVVSAPVTLVNCTLADNIGWGIARPTSAGLTVKNSILWGNTLGGIGHNQSLTLTFTDSQDGWAAGLGAGNMSADPLFVNPAGGDYHEQGVEGSYHNGAWAPDARNSPCLDAGDPASDWSLEPKPCGNRINLGAYGNTAEATRSLPKIGTVLRIY